MTTTKADVDVGRDEPFVNNVEEESSESSSGGRQQNERRSENRMKDELKVARGERRNGGRMTRRELPASSLFKRDT